VTDMTAPFREALPGDISSYNPDGDMSALEYCFVQLDTTRARTVQAFSSGASGRRPVQQAYGNRDFHQLLNHRSGSVEG